MVKIRLTLTFYLIFLSLLVFAQKKKEIIFPPPILGMEEPDFISACDLLSHKKELVYTRFIYSGAGEYWSLKPEKECIHINAQLNIPDSVVISADYWRTLKDVHKNYKNRYMIIDVIGTFEDSNASGYGHLGSNSSQFIVKHIVNMFTINKKY